MGSVRTMMGSGIGGLAAQSIHSGTVNEAVSAAGSTTADATALVADSNVVTTAASGTGVRLPDVEVGSSVIIINGQGSNALKVYPHSGGQVNNLSADAGGTIGASKSGIAVRVSSTHWALIGDLA